MEILLFVHIVISVLLIITILMQKTGNDGLGGMSGNSNNMGIITARSAATFLTSVTVVLATLFIINSIILANLSSGKHYSLVNDIESNAKKGKENVNVPMAK